MAPRRYNLGRRAQTTTATRERILQAAAVAYREEGVTATTVQSIAERADVARATVVNHFGSADGLLEAVLDQAVQEVGYPDVRALEGADSPEARARRYVDVMFRFFERSAGWWRVFAADIELPALRARERHYEEVVARFRAAAFDRLAEDRTVAAAVRAFVDYGPMYALRGAGLSLDEAITVVADALVDLIRRRTTPGHAQGG